MKTSKEGSRIRLAWDSGDVDDVEEARRFFMKLTNQGWFAVKGNGENRRVLEFESGHKELWFIPLSEGG
jgi:hypothetical protein